jgi:hypothetical protein
MSRSKEKARRIEYNYWLREEATNLGVLLRELGLRTDPDSDPIKCIRAARGIIQELAANQRPPLTPEQNAAAKARIQQALEALRSRK